MEETGKEEGGLADGEEKIQTKLEGLGGENAWQTTPMIETLFTDVSHSTSDLNDLDPVP